MKKVAKSKNDLNLGKLTSGLKTISTATKPIDTAIIEIEGEVTRLVERLDDLEVALRDEQAAHADTKTTLAGRVKQAEEKYDALKAKYESKMRAIGEKLND